jgi:hypothetical protein
MNKDGGSSMLMYNDLNIGGEED